MRNIACIAGCTLKLIIQLSGVVVSKYPIIDSHI
jgi:hypothetical protein